MLWPRTFRKGVTPIFLGPKVLAFVFLFFLAIWGWSRAVEVGVSWDEPYQRSYGEVVYAYVVDGDISLHTNSERLYGPVIPFGLILAEKVVGTLSDREGYILRHRLTWLLFLGGAGVFFLLASDLFGNRYLGLLAMLSLVLSPTLSSHGFFNTKDIPFMVGCIVTVYLASKAWLSPGLWSVVVTAIAAGITTDIRILGVLFVPVLGLLWGRHSWKHAALFFMSYSGAVYLFWPSLWASPLSVFWESMRAMSHYPWDGTVMYLGFFEYARHLPWHYLFTYMGITTPLLYLLGTALCLLRFRSGVSHPSDSALWVGLLWFFLPLGFILGSGAIVYDSWRHVFFVYPGFLLLSTYGMALLYQQFLKNTKKRRFFGIACLALSWIPVGYFMLREAPLSYVYFNPLAGHKETLHRRFETDYWGLSYREGLEWVVAHDTRPSVRVWMPHYPGEQSLPLLTTAEQQKLRLVTDSAQADYLITTFRWVTSLPPYVALYEKRVGGIPVLRVYGLSK